MPKVVAMMRYIEAVQYFTDGGDDKGGGRGIVSGAGVGTMPFGDGDEGDIVYSDDDAYSSDGEGNSDDEDDGGERWRRSADPLVGGMTTGMRPSTLSGYVPSIGDGRGDDKIDADDDDDESANSLLRAAASGDLPSVLRALDRGGDDTAATLSDSSGQTALHFAADRGDINIVNLLLSQGADPKASDDEGTSVLHAAVVGGSREAAQALLEAGADPDREDMDGYTPRGCALESGDKGMIGLFDSI